jgi:hypothetical protein
MRNLAYILALLNTISFATALVTGIIQWHQGRRGGYASGPEVLAILTYLVTWYLGTICLFILGRRRERVPWPIRIWWFFMALPVLVFSLALFLFFF